MSPGRDCRLIRVVRLCALSVAACLVVSAAVRVALKVFVPDNFVFSVKAERAAEDPELNVVFLGTSRIAYGVIPEVFDRTMDRGGVGGIHSYNVADGGESVLEAIADAETLFNLRPHGVKFVLFEPDLTSQLIIREPDSARAIEFFTVPHAFLAIRFMNFPVRTPGPAISTVDYVGNIIAATLRHYSNIGLARAEPDPPDPTISATSRGYSDLDDRIRRPMPIDELYERYVASVRQIGTRPRPELISDDHLNLILSLASFIESKGAIPILIRPPQDASWDFADAFAAKFEQRCAGKRPLFFNFGSPQEYGELYASWNRWDSDHLNAAGATIFSTLIAERLARAIRDDTYSRPLCD
jgi:hypothetical protein